MMTPDQKKPYICEPTDQRYGKPASFIFVHGYADDAEGMPLGLAQQFQFNHKLQYLRWVLPNAPRHKEAAVQSWYLPKALPNSMKPQVPGQKDETELDGDDEEGIMATVDYIDELIDEEISRGVEPKRIVVGGFSQGCAVTLVWGLVGKNKDKVAGVIPCSGYFPLSDRIEALRKERGTDTPNQLKWLYVHGNKDLLVPNRLFEHGQEQLKKWLGDAEGKDEGGYSTSVIAKVYDGMGHSTCNAQLRDMLVFIGGLVPPGKV